MRRSRLVLVVLALAVGSQALNLNLIPPQTATMDQTMVSTWVQGSLSYYNNNPNIYEIYDGDASTTFEIAKKKGKPGMVLAFEFLWKTRVRELVIKIAPDVSKDKYPRDMILYAASDPNYDRLPLLIDRDMQFNANGVYRKKLTRKWVGQLFELHFFEKNPLTIAMSELQLIGPAGPYKRHFPDKKWPCSKELSTIVPPAGGLFSFPKAVADRYDGKTSVKQGLPVIFNTFGIFKKNEWHDATFPGENKKVMVGATFDKPTKVLVVAISARSQERVQVEIQGSFCNPAAKKCDLSGDGEWTTICKLTKHDSFHFRSLHAVEKPALYYSYRIVATPVKNANDGVISFSHVHFMTCDA